MARIRIALKISRRNSDLGRRLARANNAGVNRAADFLVDELQKVVSTPNPFRTRNGWENRANKDAGKPPYARTGEGVASIQRTGKGRISMLRYLVFLDRGTRRINPRPWYRVTIEKFKKKLAELAFGK